MEAETVCHPSTEKTEMCQPEAPRCNKKMLKYMRFSLSMEDDLSPLQEPSSPQPELKEKDNEDNEDDEDDVFLSLATMSLNLVDQESDGDDETLCKCDESYIESDTAGINYISTQIWKVIKEQADLFLKIRNKYVASKHNKICLENTMSAKITIFYCAVLGTSNNRLGVPVVLNFTDTDNFLCCTTQGEEKAIKLTIKVHKINEIKKKQLSAKDPENSSLIFYMSQKYDGLRYFESALHKGWFIHTVSDDVVKMGRGNSTSSSCFVVE